MNTNNNANYTIGVVLVSYGIFKIILGLIIAFIPYKYIEEYRTLTHFITDDHTISGKFIYYILVLYGVITLFHGLSLMRVDRFLHMNFSKNALYFINMMLGIVLVGYYYLVLYTNVDLPKDEKYNNTYIHDLVIGLTFIFFVPLLVMYHYIEDNKFFVSKHYMLYFFSITWVLMYILYFILQKLYNFQGDFLSFMVIPLNIL